MVCDMQEEWEALGHSVEWGHDPLTIRPADFCFCLSLSRIVPAEVRKNFKHTLVVHESDLPKGRGWSPMTWQILEGENRIPVTLFEAVDAVDAGPIYLQEWITLDGTELSPQWRSHLALTTKRLCMQWVNDYPSVIKKARPQTGMGSFYPRRRPADSRLDPSKTLAEQFNLLRVVDNDNYPAFFKMHGKLYQISVERKDSFEK